MFIRFCCTSLMTLVLCCSHSWKFTVLSAALSVWHGCAPCVGPLLVVGAVLVLTDRLDLLSSSLRLPGVSGMSSPGIITLGPSLAPSSGSGKKAICIMFLPSSLSPSFMVRISCADPGGANLGFILGMRYYIFLLAFPNLMSLCMWPNSLSMLVDILCIKVPSCISFLSISSLSPCNCALSCLRMLSPYSTQRST